MSKHFITAKIKNYRNFILKKYSEYVFFLCLKTFWEPVVVMVLITYISGKVSRESPWEDGENTDQ